MEGARERRRNEGNGRVGAMGEERPVFLHSSPHPLPAARILYAGEGPGWGQDTPKNLYTFPRPYTYRPADYFLILEFYSLASKKRMKRYVIL